MSEYVPQESLDGWIVAHDKQKARAEAAERDRDLYMDAWREEKQQRIDAEAALARDQLLREVAATDEETT